MKKVLVTGGSGRIATIIREELAGQFAFTFVDSKVDMKTDVSYLDVSHDPSLYDAAVGTNTIIHLAWNAVETHKSAFIDPKNKTMAENVFKIADLVRAKRVIMASSVHVDSFQDHRGPHLMRADTVPTPNNRYGATKVYLEALGRYYAARYGFGVICPRFGGVSVDNKLREEKDYRSIWLSRKDCASLIKCCLEAKSVPGSFSVFYAVSNNANRIHDWKNPIGWEPEDDSSKAFG